ncbi:MAG: alpha/beta fold hydrolase [Burkholderiales bacterium]|nr:alpha/beta fold hydrolase [Burkholderiales bacterium]
MLAAFLRVLLLLELLVYWGVARSLAATAPWWGIALAIGAIALAWRFAAVAAVFLVAAVLRAGAPHPKLGVFDACALFVREAMALARVYGLHMPLSRRTLSWPDGPRTRAGRPVILVHGIYSNGAIWHGLAQRLRRAGVGPLLVADLGPVLGSIDRQADWLAATIEQAAARSALGRVALVAHSMGGLVVRRAIVRHGAARIERLITIGCPHRGSRMARFAFGAAARELLPGSSWLSALRAAEPAALSVPTTALYSLHDELVIPPQSALLEGARNIDVSGHGHVALLFSNRVAAVVAAELAKES